MFDFMTARYLVRAFRLLTPLDYTRDDLERAAKLLSTYKKCREAGAREPRVRFNTRYQTIDEPGDTLYAELVELYQAS